MRDDDHRGKYEAEKVQAVAAIGKRFAETSSSRVPIQPFMLTAAAELRVDGTHHRDAPMPTQCRSDP